MINPYNFWGYWDYSIIMLGKYTCCNLRYWVHEIFSQYRTVSPTFGSFSSLPHVSLFHGAYADFLFFVCALPPFLFCGRGPSGPNYWTAVVYFPVETSSTPWAWHLPFACSRYLVLFSSVLGTQERNQLCLLESFHSTFSHSFWHGTCRYSYYAHQVVWDQDSPVVAVLVWVLVGPKVYGWVWLSCA